MQILPAHAATIDAQLIVIILTLSTVLVRTGDVLLFIIIKKREW